MELDTCIEGLMMTSDIREQTDREGPVFLGGDLNARMGRITGDSVANFRLTIRYTFRDLGLVWMKPNVGKWTLEITRGRSIVDYIMANPGARKLVKKERDLDECNGSRIRPSSYIV